MNQESRLDPPPRGVTILDLLLFTAGFACGWVMHQHSALRAGDFYHLPFSRGAFDSLLGSVWAIWLWAAVTGLAFLVIGRRFRYDCRGRIADYLVVALAVVLFESVYPAFRTKQVGSMDGEMVWLNVPGVSAPLGGTAAYDLWWPNDGEAFTDRLLVALQLTAAGGLIGIAAWRFRALFGPGATAVAGVAIAALFTLGLIRLAEGTSIEVKSSAVRPGFQLSSGEKPWSWPVLAANCDARAWGGYALRALVLITLAMLVGRDFVKRGREWLWTERAAVVATAIIACCWLYGEFYARPALERKVRVVFLCTWLATIALVAWGTILVRDRLRNHFRRADVAAHPASIAEPRIRQ